MNIASNYIFITVTRKNSSQGTKSRNSHQANTSNTVREADLITVIPIVIILCPLVGATVSHQK